MNSPCTRCGLDCEGSCLKLADGTHPGREKLIGRRVAVTYPWSHQRKGEPARIEIRHAIGRVAAILPDGALWVVTDREGGLRIEPQAMEVIQ